MGEYAAFLLILVLGFACGYGTARARGEKQSKPPATQEPSAWEIKTDANTRVEAFGFFDNKVEGGTMVVGRRRDDNRAQRAPEEPWN